MGERYKSLFKSTCPQVQDGLAILFSAGALLGDTSTGKVIAQLKFQNIGAKVITAVYASLTCFDAMNTVVGTGVEAKYMDLGVNPGSYFGDRVPIVMTDNSVRSFQVKITSVMFSDGSSWHADETAAMKQIEEPECQLTIDQIKQLQIDAAGSGYMTSPIKIGNRVRCACSQWNDGNVKKCIKCGSDLDWLLNNSNCDKLQEHLEKRLAEEAETAERKRIAEEQKAEADRIEREKRDKEAAERKAIEAAKKKKRNIVIGTISGVVVAGALVFGFVIKPEMDRKSSYQAAVAMLENKEYDAATTAFTDLGTYKDSETMISRVNADKLFDSGDYVAAYEVYKNLGSEYQVHEEEYKSIYADAEDAMENENFEDAISLFESIRGYSDSADKVDAVYYEDAVRAFDSGDYEGAKAKFDALGEYSDSAAKAQAIADYESGIELQGSGKYAEAREAYQASGILDFSDQIEECYAADYSNAETLYDNGDISGAYALFASISDYSDSADKAAAIETAYSQAEKDAEGGKYDEAISGYEALKNYSDSEEKVKATIYAKAESQLNSESYDDAIATFETLGEYEDSTSRILEIHYTKAQMLENSGDEKLAAEEYAACGDYEDSEEKLVSLSLEIADEAFENKDYGTALEYYTNLEQTDELKEKEYELAQTCYEEGIYEQAVKAYEVLGQYELSVSRLPVARYAWAEELQANEQYKEASEQFAILGETSDSASRTIECSYLYGKQLLDAKSYDDAKAVFETITDYSDAADMVKESDYQKAADQISAGEYATAGELFMSLKDYKDSETQSNECAYQIAKADLETKEYETAQSEFEALGEYSDSTDLVKLCIYERANILYSAFNYEDAQALYESISGYNDADDLALVCRYQQGIAAYDAGDYDKAIEILEGNAVDENSSMVLAKSHYEKGVTSIQSGDVEGAVIELASATVLPEAQELLYGIGKDYASMNQTSKAIETLWACGDHEGAKSMLSEVASLLVGQGLVEDGLIAYYALDKQDEIAKILKDNPEIDIIQELEEYSLLVEVPDFKSHIIYSHAGVLAENNDLQKAISYYERVKGYKDTDDILLSLYNFINLEDSDWRIEETSYGSAYYYKRINMQPALDCVAITDSQHILVDEGSFEVSKYVYDDGEKEKSIRLAGFINVNKLEECGVDIELGSIETERYNYTYIGETSYSVNQEVEYTGVPYILYYNVYTDGEYNSQGSTVVLEDAHELYSYIDVEYGKTCEITTEAVNAINLSKYEDVSGVSLGEYTYEISEYDSCSGEIEIIEQDNRTGLAIVKVEDNNNRETSYRVVEIIEGIGKASTYDYDVYSTFEPDYNFEVLYFVPADITVDKKYSINS